jgi:hypothetical protein
MKDVPSTWDEVKYIDGYPGRYVILARRHGNQWYVAGVNAEKKILKETIDLSSFSDAKRLAIYTDDANLQGTVKTVKAAKRISISIPCNGGVVIKTVE